MPARLVVRCKRSTDGAELVYYLQYEGRPGESCLHPGALGGTRSSSKRRACMILAGEENLRISLIVILLYHTDHRISCFNI